MITDEKKILFIKARIRTLVREARAYPRTCQMVRSYMNRAFEWALKRRDVDLMDFINEQEGLILGRKAA